MSPAPTTLLGASLKLYLGHRDTLEWTRAVAEIAAADAGVSAGHTEIVLLPSFVSIESAARLTEGGPVRVGAQDLSAEDRGAFTGEVSGADLAELGCRFVEVGHAERRALFGEDEETVAAKLAAAARNDLTPILCVGEPARGSAEEAASVSIAQIRSALARLDGPIRELVVAYEPVWAIGAAEPAEPAHVRAVCRLLRAELAENPLVSSGRIIYGGSAGPGTLASLGEDVDGLFLGRFAHNPEAFRDILEESRARLDLESSAR